MQCVELTSSRVPVAASIALCVFQDAVATAVTLGELSGRSTFAVTAALAVFTWFADAISATRSLTDGIGVAVGIGAIRAGPVAVVVHSIVA